MKVIFLDFDGVLNSAASFLVEKRKRDADPGGLVKFCKLNETLDPVCASNFQALLQHYPEAKVVISSTWRELFDLEWLKEKLASYGIDSSRVIGRTPSLHFKDRGEEIAEWMEDNKDKGVTEFVILDDNFIGGPYQKTPFEDCPNIVKTRWNVGLTLDHVAEAVKKLGGRFPKHQYYMED